MAVIILGKSKCPLCCKLMREGQNLISFPHFVANELDPAWVFSDRAFHVECFQSHPLAEKAQTRYEEIMARSGPGNRFCVVCKGAITDPDDYFTVGHLVDDEHHPLYRYNYTQAHRSHLSAWAELTYVYKLIEDLKQSGTWQGEALDRLLTELSAAVPFTSRESLR